MCTVTYWPKSSGFILSVNRDEMASRAPAKFPVYKDSKRGRICFPQDPEAGGTWIAYSSELVVSLLNGSYEDDPSKFTKSRGLVALEPFQHASLDQFISNCNFENVNAFVMNIFEKEDGVWQITQLKWDTKDLVITYPNAMEPQIWVSIPKKFQQVLDWREEQFEQLTFEEKVDQKMLKDFHMKGGKPGEEAVRLLPNDIVLTTNFTQLQVNQNVKLIEHQQFA